MKPTFYLSRSFTFDAAHTLIRDVPIEQYEASQRIHGHSYTATVTVCGKRNGRGMLVDLHDFDRALSVARAALDHRFLDHVEGIGPATIENLCVFIHAKVAPLLPRVVAVEVSRAAGDSCRATWGGR